MQTIVSSILEIKQGIKGNLYFVGGSLRDTLLNRFIKDWDLVIEEDTMAFSKEITEVLKGSFEKVDEEKEIYRIVLSDGVVINCSKMKGKSIKEDLQQRDFTMNAMAYDLERGWPIDKKQIIDPCGGLEDLEKKMIRHVHKNVFVDDPARIIRAVRFMVELHFNIDHETILLIKENSEKIDSVEGEVLTEELFSILKAENSYFYLNYMNETLGILYKLFPELEKMKEVGECKYHVVDCWTHSIYTVKMAEQFIYSTNYFEDHIRQAYEEHTSEIMEGGRTRLDLIKLGALFHDIGKPSARKVDETGRTRFRGHEITGAEIIREYAEKLKLSIKERDILYRYVELHMLPLMSYKNNDVSGRVLYEIFTQMGEETLDILLIALSDIIATRKLLVPDEEMGMFKVHIEYIANNYLTRYRPVEKIDSIITVREIMEGLELPPSVLVRNALEEVKKALYFGKIPPTKEAALGYLKRIL